MPVPSDPAETAKTLPSITVHKSRLCLRSFFGL